VTVRGLEKLETIENETVKTCERDGLNERVKEESLSW